MTFYIDIILNIIYFKNSDLWFLFLKKQLYKTSTLQNQYFTFNNKTYQILSNACVYTMLELPLSFYSCPVLSSRLVSLSYYVSWKLIFFCTVLRRNLIDFSTQSPSVKLGEITRLQSSLNFGRSVFFSTVYHGKCFVSSFSSLTAVSLRRLSPLATKSSS